MATVTIQKTSKGIKLLVLIGWLLTLSIVGSPIGIPLLIVGWIARWWNHA